MISWIQTYFQKHFKVIFTVLLGVTIISFIFTIGSTPGIGHSENRITNRDFFGHNLVSTADQQRLSQDGQLSAGLQMRQDIYNEGGLQRYAFDRTAALSLADQLHLPPPTDAQVKAFIQTLPAFQDKDGNFDAARYAAFRQDVSTGGRLNESDIVRVISDDVRASEVEHLLAGPGYVLPADILTYLQLGDTVWTLSTATVDFASYKPAIAPTDAQLAKFFGDNSFRYKIAPKVSVNLIEFPSRLLGAQVTVTDADVRGYYETHAAQFPAPAVKAPAKPDANANYLAVKPQVEAALRKERADQLALKNASDFTVALYNANLSRDTALGQFIASRKLEVRQLPDFSQDQPPADLAGSPEAAEAAFRLDSKRFYSDAVPVPAGAAVLIWNKTTPERDPLLAEVKAKVLADYVENERRKRFVELGATLKGQLQAAVKAGTAFDKAALAAAASNAVKIDVKTYPAFSLRSRAKNPAESAPEPVLNTLQTLKKGQVSDMTSQEDNGVLVYAVDQKVPALSPTNPGYAQARLNLAVQGARSAPGADLSELVDSELKRTEPPIK